MPDPAVLGLFLLTVLLLNLTPGPDMVFCFASGISHGRMAGLAAAGGVSLGVLVHTLAAGLGVAALVKAHPLAFDLLRFLGAGYLLWLAWQSWRATGGLGTPELRQVPAERRPEIALFLRRGAITNVLNPKVALFFLAFLPQFASPGGEASLAAQMIVLGSVIALTSVFINGAVGLSAGILARRLLARPGLLRVQRRIAAVIFGVLALRLLAVETL